MQCLGIRSKPSKAIKNQNMGMQCSRLTFVCGATASAPEALVRAVPPLPPCSFVGDKTSTPRIACLWNFLVTACQTRPADYAFKNSQTVKKRWILAHFQQETGISSCTGRNYLTEQSRKFTWDQVFSAAGLWHATSPPLHTLHAPLWVIKPVHCELHVSGTSW